MGDSGMKITKHMHIMGQNVLNSATVLQSKNSPKMYMSNVPILMAVLPSEPRDPLSLGSDISPTYDDVDPAPNPVLNPISKVDAQSNTDECAEYSSTHPKILGTFASIIQRFFPNLSCRIPDSKHPTGWIMNNKLPYHEASVIVIENSLFGFRYKSRMTIADIDRFMPNPMNRKLCAIVAKHCANVAFGPYFRVESCAWISFTSGIDNRTSTKCDIMNGILLINGKYVNINSNRERVKSILHLLLLSTPRHINMFKYQ